MTDVSEVIARSGGVASTRDLQSSGFSRRRIGAAVAAGDILRIRAGWFCLPASSSDAVRAIRAGGSLTCISGAAVHGLWVPGSEPLHISLRRGDRHVRDPDSGGPADLPDARLVVHWGGQMGIDVSRGILPIATCLADVLRCQPADLAFATIESALRQRRLSRAQREWLWRVTARRRRMLLRHANGLADSGSESIFRFRMALLKVTVRSQVDVPGVGRVDFVIGDRLIVEIDSQEHHGSRADRLRDLRRDAIASGLGFICLRFDYDQILHDWATVEATVMAIVGRGDHLRP